jgi:hypothetical protein
MRLKRARQLSEDRIEEESGEDEGAIRDQRLKLKKQHEKEEANKFKQKRLLSAMLTKQHDERLNRLRISREQQKSLLHISQFITVALCRQDSSMIYAIVAEQDR